MSQLHFVAMYLQILDDFRVISNNAFGTYEYIGSFEGSVDLSALFARKVFKILCTLSLLSTFFLNALKFVIIVLSRIINKKNGMSK